MLDPAVHIRRSRRTDFTAVMNLLASSGEPVPPPDRATLRRFRHIVADLGADFYLAMVDESLAGLVYVTYARQLTVAPRARVDQLLVGREYRRRGIGSALLAFARQRAQRRGCGDLLCLLPNADDGARSFLTKAGLQPAAQVFAQRCGVDG